MIKIKKFKKDQFYIVRISFCASKDMNVVRKDNIQNRRKCLQIVYLMGAEAPEYLKSFKA